MPLPKTNNPHRFPAIPILWVMVCFVNAKSIFCDYDADLSYALATSYRNITGDAMFLQMWEPHQTSSFLCTPFMYLYHSIFKTWAGCGLFMQLIGVLLFTAVALLLLHVLKKYLPVIPAHIISILFFTLRAKMLVFPEFSNMLILFSVLMFIFLLLYFEDNTPKALWLVLAALMNCLAVLSYPSAVILFPVAIVLIAVFTGNAGKKRAESGMDAQNTGVGTDTETAGKSGLGRGGAIALYTSICLLSGALYLLFFCLRIGPSTLLESVSLILSSDSAHAEKGMSIWNYTREIVFAIAEFGAGYAVYFIVYGIARNKKKLKLLKYPIVFTVFYGINLVVCLCLDLAGKGNYKLWSYTAGFSYVVLMIIAFTKLKTCEKRYRRIFVTGVALSLGVFASVVMLTNLSLITVMNYLILGAMVSVIPIYARAEKLQTEQIPTEQVSAEIEQSSPVSENAGSLRPDSNQPVISNKKGPRIPYAALLPVIIAFFLLLHRGIIFQDYSLSRNTITGINAIVRSGPARGILCSYMGYYEEQCNMRDFTNNVAPGSALLLVSDRVDASIYLYNDYRISHYSTIDTPTYGESLQDYWSRFPDKTPDVIAVECWYGDYHFPADSEFFRYITEEYSEPVYGDYYAFFYRK